MSSTRAPRTVWTDEEIHTLLALVNEKKLSTLLDSKRQKNKDIFVDLENSVKELRLQWTWEQIRTCWKNLKKTLHGCKYLHIGLIRKVSWRLEL